MDVSIRREGRDWVVRGEQTLDAPLERVFPFFADARNLERLTPAFLRFRVVTPGAIEMCVGTLIDYRFRVRGVPIRWRTKIVDWSPPRRFADVQLRGPYARWRHTHEFEDMGDRTRCTDLVLYRPPGGPLAPLVNALAVRRDVERIFRHRMRELEAIFAGSPPAALTA